MGKPPEPPRMDYDAYSYILVALRVDYPDRMNLATVAGWLAPLGMHVDLIAAQMGRDQMWVRRRIEVLKEILPRPLGLPRIPPLETH